LTASGSAKRLIPQAPGEVYGGIQVIPTIATRDTPLKGRREEKSFSDLRQKEK